MNNKNQWIGRYALALAAVAAAFLLRQGIIQLIGGELPPWVTFYPTVMLVALLAGFGPGILATVTSALVAAYMYFPPEGFGVAGNTNAVGIALFMTMGVFMSEVAGHYRRIRDSLEGLVAERTVEMRQTNVELRREVDVRKQAEEALQKANEELEKRVEERTRDLKEANESAKAERQRLYDVLETLPVYVVLLTSDYHVPFANRFFRERFGESEGRRCYEYLFNRTEPCEICETYSILKTNAPHHWYWTGPDGCDYDIYDYPFVDSDGSTLILETGIDITEQKQAQKALKEMNDSLEERIIERTAQLQSATETLRASRLAALNLMEDAVTARRQAEETSVELRREIAERMRAEEALRESEARFRTLLMNIPGAAYRCEIKAPWRMSFMSKGVEAITGYPATEFLRPDVLAWGELVLPEDLPGVEQAVEVGVENMAPYEMEYRIRHADGGIRWVFEQGRAVYDAEGRASCLDGVILDITERKRAEQSLRESEKRFHSLFENMMEGFAYCKMLYDDLGSPVDFVYLDVNSAFGRLTGLENVEGKRVTELIPGIKESTPELLETYGRVALTGKPERFEIDFKPLAVWLSVSVYSMEMEYFVAVFDDITKRKVAEEALQKAHDELEAKVEERTAEIREKDQLLLQQSRQAAMGEMIGNIAHQWRQPLNTLSLIIGMLPMMHEAGELTQEQLESTEEKAIGIIQHMSQTIDDFSNYFKPDKEKVKFHAGDAVAKTLTLIEDSFGNREIAIEVKAEDDLVINGYPNEFSQVLLNILLNARDAFSDRGVGNARVVISMSGENGRTVVTVTDNAGGIPEEIIDKIFDPYFTTKGPEQGTGVGLFMSKGIIEKNMGGRLTVRNTGNGAEFRIEV